MLSLLLIVSGRNRRITADNNTVCKHYKIHSTPSNHLWSGMNELDAFYHEAQILLHIEKNAGRCNRTDEVGRLIGIDAAGSHTIKTERLGTPIKRCNRFFFGQEVRRIKSFFDCIGVMHCDTQVKNFGVVERTSRLYIFDMDLAYIVARGKPSGMACGCNLTHPCQA